MNKYIPSKNVIISGMLGKATGDAVGVPVEFEDRKKRDNDPVVDMRGFGTYGKPAGTWSDDTSMTLAAMASIVDEKKVDFAKIMEYFILWNEKGYFTTDGDAFDRGITVSGALEKYKQHKDIKECGPTDDSTSGNGSLMRILPFAMYYADGLLTGDIEAINSIAIASGITHNSLLCREICIVYSTVLAYFAKNADDVPENANVDENKMENLSQRTQNKENLLQSAISRGFENVKKYCDNLADIRIDKRILFAKDVSLFHLFDGNSIDELPSGGFVLDSFRAALWCFVMTNSYKECVLKAVNLGKDTDTTAAIVGALAGIYYSSDDIPEDWKKTVIRANDIESTCEEFHSTLLGKESYIGKTMLDMWNPHMTINNNKGNKQKSIINIFFGKKGQ